MNTQKNEETRLRYIKRLEEPPIAKSLFGDVRWSWIWLILRLYLGYEWLSAGIGKLTNSAWVGAHAGTALTGFVNNALTETTGAHPNVQAWYAWFLQHIVLPNAATWGVVVSLGETLVGIALILGIFTGIAAFFGSFMDMSYLLAGSVSLNPILLTIALFLILAWKTAGWWGLDRWVLTSLGTPWRPGLIFHERGDTSNKNSGDQSLHQPHQA